MESWWIISTVVQFQMVIHDVCSYSSGCCEEYNSALGVDCTERLPSMSKESEEVRSKDDKLDSRGS